MSGRLTWREQVGEADLEGTGRGGGLGGNRSGRLTWREQVRKADLEGTGQGG